MSNSSSENAYFAIDRSADPAFAATTWVVADAELLAEFGSDSLALILAVLVIVTGFAGAFTTMVIVAVAPMASEPTMQVTVLEAWVQVPWVELAETNVTPAGRVSVTVVPVAPFGPLLVAVRV